MTSHGHFCRTGYCITNPVTPRPWINYLGNRRLRAFLSHNAGGALWYREPYSARITRYHYTSAPGDRPGFYLYVRDRGTGELWNPHFAPACTKLDLFECRHRPGVTEFVGRKNGLEVSLGLGIPPSDDALLWSVRAKNVGQNAVDAELVSYMEFGLLELLREVVGWCYLKNQFGLHFDPDLCAIRYDYHVFEAPVSPAMLAGCTEPLSGWECSRDAFIGRTGGYGHPEALRPGRCLGNSDLPLGGHACAVQGVDVALAPGEERRFGLAFVIAEDWSTAETILARYRDPDVVAAGFAEIDTFWADRLRSTVVATGDETVDAMLNTWIPYNSVVALELARTISTDHMGSDGLRYRDTMQDALAVANLDPPFARQRICQVLATQTAEGGGCFAFFPDDGRPVSDEPRRSDNTVWPVYTVMNYLAETGDTSFLGEEIPYRDGSTGTVYEHVVRGLRYIHERRGPNGLPTLYHADWNDGLALFGDEDAESVMLGMQLVYACRLFRELAAREGEADDEVWCGDVIDELSAILNSDLVWDGRWYRRLILSDGGCLGSGANRQGQIYLNPQSWAVISGVGDFEDRGRVAMDAAAEFLDSEAGLRILAPPFTGIPEPEDPPLGSNPGVGENGGIFCHANTWAVIAECLLGRGDRAWKYFHQMLPPVVSTKFGADHYQREPYVFVSSIVGPASDRFGEGGISWLTGTANWMHVAALQYIFGVRPTLDGLVVEPCLPTAISEAGVTRRYRGATYEIALRREGNGPGSKGPFFG